LLLLFVLLLSSFHGCVPFIYRVCILYEKKNIFIKLKVALSRGFCPPKNVGTTTPPPCLHAVPSSHLGRQRPVIIRVRCNRYQ